MTGVTVEAQAARAVDLCKTYGAGHATVRALDNVSVAFERGRFTAVMGPSGSGKSTLMHCMAGLDRPTSGTTYVGDLDIGHLDDAGLTKLRRDRIGFVFQYFKGLLTPGKPERRLRGLYGALIGGWVLARTSSSLTPGASSTRASPSGVMSSTHRSVMIRWTTPLPV